MLSNQESRELEVNSVKKILAAHDPKVAQNAAEGVTGTARNFGRDPEELARELVAILKEPLDPPPGLRAVVMFSYTRRTYEWIAYKETRQQRRHAARQRTKVAH